MVQLTKDEIIKITMRLQSVRQGLVQKAPFYAILLFGLRFSLDDMVERVYTDGERIAFNPDFLKEVGDRELEFIMLHEVSHVALGHPFRRVSDYDIAIYDEACDIVVNSNIYHYMGDDESFITINGLGVMPHTLPNKNYKEQEGYRYTVEQVYEHLFKIKGRKEKDEDASSPDFSEMFDEEDYEEDDLFNDERNDKIDSGEEVDENMEDSDEDTEDESDDEIDGDTDKSGEETEACEDGEKSKPNKKGKAKEEGNDEKSGEAVSKRVGKNPHSSSLQKKGKLRRDNQIIRDNKQIILKANVKVTCFDDHSFWKGEDEKNIKQQLWAQKVINAIEVQQSMDESQIVLQKKIMSKKQAHKGFGGPPMFATRILEELTEGKLDWRTLLNDFVQEEVCDYSFSPPDRRFGDSDFFLPDFNEKQEKIKNVWFLIDTSGSISDGMIMDAYNEIASAVEIFGGSIESYLSFTESFITKPTPFSSVGDLLAVKPKGGGGNDFKLIFKYLETGDGIDLLDESGLKISVDEIIEPSCIVIITDGYDAFPEESAAKGIPVLWLINNDDPSATPPWGMVARIPQKEK